MKQRDEIKNLVSQILRAFRPEKIILFGSHAYGKPGQDSDIDLMVIMSTRKNTLVAAADIRKAVEHDYPLDIIVRTPAQVRQRLKWGDSFITQVMAKGKILYEAPDQRMD